MHSMNRPPEILHRGGFCSPRFLLFNQKTYGVRRDIRTTADNWHSSRYRDAVIIKQLLMSLSLLFWMNKSAWAEGVVHVLCVWMRVCFSSHTGLISLLMFKEKCWALHISLCQIFKTYSDPAKEKWHCPWQGWPGQPVTCQGSLFMLQTGAEFRGCRGIN